MERKFVGHLCLTWKDGSTSTDDIGAILVKEVPDGAIWAYDVYFESAPHPDSKLAGNLTLTPARRMGEKIPWSEPN